MSSDDNSDKNQELFNDDGMKSSLKQSSCIDAGVVPNSEIPCYDMSKKGYAVIFNHVKCKGYETRKGTDEDTTRLENCLKRLNFDVVIHNDLNVRGIFTIMSQVMKMCDISCLVVVVLSHGEHHNQIIAKDTNYNVSYLWRNLQDKLHGIPKLFFIQACRGKMTDHGYDETDSVVPAPPEKLPINSDMLQMFSSHELYYSYREDTGSWFITELCEVFESHAADYNLMELLTFVNRNVANKYQGKNKTGNLKQMPQIVTSLSKSLKFNTKNYHSVRD